MNRADSNGSHPTSHSYTALIGALSSMIAVLAVLLIVGRDTIGSALSISILAIMALMLIVLGALARLNTQKGGRR